MALMSKCESEKVNISANILFVLVRISLAVIVGADLEWSALSLGHLSNTPSKCCRLA